MLIVVLFALLLAQGTLVSQPGVSTGAIHGAVTDPGKRTVPAATVTVTDPVTGISWSMETDDSGEFRFARLPPAGYHLRVEKLGFRTHSLAGVPIVVGQTTTVDLQLHLGDVMDTIEVTAVVPLIERERVHQSNTLQRAYVSSLPIDRRDYLTLTLLAPGVADADALADNSDFRVVQTPHSGLSFYGSNGRGNSVTVDGGEANDDAGGVRETLSQDAILEFQINRSNYSAELGFASGGVINIVTQSGGNTLHGTLFSLFRHDSLDAADPFARTLQGSEMVRVKPPSDRQQFGASAGFPIRKNRTFLFGAFEGLRREESSVVSLLTDLSIFNPTPAQNEILATLPAEAAGALRSALTASPATVELFRRNSGVFPFRSRDWKFSVRGDHRATQTDDLFLRFNYANVDETNANVRALVGASRGNDTSAFDNTALLGWTHAFSERTVNEARVQGNYHYDSYNTLEKFGPEINIAGFGIFNRDLYLPSYVILRRLEARNNVILHRGDHALRTGAQLLVRGNHSESHTFFPGRFTFGQLPGSLLSSALASTTLTALQSFNLGLAQTFQQGFGNPTVAGTLPYLAGYLQDTWKVRRGLTLDFGVRYEIDVRQEPLRTDKNNVAPRLGFAWTPDDGSTVVRGGYGIFYSPIYYQIDYVVNALGIREDRRQISQVFTTIQSPGPDAAHRVFTTLRNQGVIGIPTPARSITAADLLQFGIQPGFTGPPPPLSAIFESSPDYVNPYAQQASLNLERSFLRDLAVSATYTYVRTLKITRARDKNLLPAPVDPRLGIRVWSTPYFVDPTIAQFNVYESTARAFYSGLVLELRKRFSHSFSLEANYTYSRAIDEVIDFNSDFQANDQTNLRAERALSAFDQRHKFVFFGVWRAPMRFDISPIFRANSGRPFNLLAGFDINADRHPTTDRPVGAGRNTGQGPNFVSFDLRVARAFRFGEYKQLEFMAESFNLLNRLNYSSVNNTVGNIPGPFNLKGREDRSPSEALGFTAAYDPRRMQLGIRFRF